METGERESNYRLRKMTAKPWSWRYGLALAAVGGATLLRFAVEPLLGDTAQFITFFVAIVLAGAVGGRGPALAATALSTVAVVFFFIAPRGQFFPMNLAHGISVGMFAAAGLTISWIAGRMFHARRAAQTRANALRQSEQRLNRSQAMAHLGSWELDLVRNRLTWSDEVYRIFGLRPQEFTATYEAFLAAVHPDDRAAVDGAYSGSLREGRDSYEIEHRVVRRATGEVRWVQERCEHIRDASGKIIRSVGMVLDITERKQSQEALRESEQRIRQKLESILSPEGDIGSLELGDIIDVPAVQSLMDDFYRLAHLPMAIIDLKGKVLVGVGWQDVCTQFHRVHPEACRNCLESDLQLTAGVPVGQCRLYQCKNFMWDIATPIAVAGQHVGNLFSGQFFFDDETVDYDRFRAQARRYGFDEGKYLAALKAAPRLSRPTVDTGMAFFMKLADMLSKLSYSNLKLARSLAERDALMAALKAAKDELEIRVRERTAELTKANAELARSNQDLQQFAYVASHDLQEPLRMVDGFMKLLGQRYKGKLDESADQYIEFATDGARRMQRLIHDLLEYSRVDTRGKSFAPTDGEKVLREVLHSLKVRIDETQARITHDPLPTVSADETQLLRVFLNLIGNALKFRRPDQTPVIHIGVERHDGHWQFAVRDNGIGIAPEHHESIFVIFRRLHSRRQYEGTGIGLAVVKKIVERHGGKIWVDSAPGAGTAFFFTLPSA